jgi:hypothetical protein
VGSVRGRRRGRQRVRIGAPDPTLTPVSGLLAVSELVERLDVIGRFDAVVGPIKQRRRGHTGGQLLVGLAAAQLAGEDFLVGLDRQRADATGQQLTPVPGLCATTAAGPGPTYSGSPLNRGDTRALELPGHRNPSRTRSLQPSRDHQPATRGFESDRGPRLSSRSCARIFALAGRVSYRRPLVR